MNKLKATIAQITSHPLAKGSLVMFGGSMVSNIGAYLYHLVVGRVLGPVGYGELASLYSLLYLLNVPALVVQTVIARYVSKYKATGEPGKAKALFTKANKIFLAVLLFSSVAVFPASKVLGNYLHATSVWSVVFMLAGAGVFFLATLVTGVLQGYQRFGDLAIYGNIGVYLRLAGGAVGAYFGVLITALANLITTVASYVISFIPIRFLFAQKSKSTGVTYREIGSYGLPSLFCILGITSLYSTDLIMVKHFFSPFDAGLYAALTIMGKVVYFASSSVSYVLFPVISEREHLGVKTYSLVYWSLLIVLSISALITIGYVLFPNLALMLLFGTSYIKGAPYLGLFGIFMTFFSLANVLATTLLGVGKVKVWIFTVFAAVIQIAGISFYHGSLTQVLYVNITTSLTLTVLLLLYYRHEIKRD